MAWYKTVTLTCDFCGNDADTAEATVEDARKSEGWIVRRGQDVCTECQDA